MEIQELIKQLTEQVNVKNISTIDLVKDLEGLYNKVGHLESELKCETILKEEGVETIKKLREEIKPTIELEKEFALYKADVKKFQEEKDEHEKEVFKFDVEKEYINNENDRLNEILMAMLATKNVNYSDYGNGSSMNYCENPVKPDLKGLSKRATKETNVDNNCN